MFDCLEVVVLLAIFVRLGRIAKLLDSEDPETGFGIQYLLSEIVISLRKGKSK